MNRENYATAKRVGRSVAAIDETQTSFNKDIVGNFQGTSEFVPSFGSPPDSECAHVVAIEPPRTEIPASSCRVGRGQQAIVIPNACLRDGVEQLCAPLTTLVLNLIGVAKRDARFRRKFFNCAYEVEMFDLAHKGDDITLCSASEAVIELLLGINRERARLLLVKWAQALPAATDPFELHMLRDDRDNVSGIPHCCDVIVLNAHVTLRGGR